MYFTQRCCVLQELAEVEGDAEKAEDLRLELEDLEGRAKELDTRRTSTISAIRSLHNNSFINSFIFIMVPNWKVQ